MTSLSAIIQNRAIFEQGRIVYSECHGEQSGNNTRTSVHQTVHSTIVENLSICECRKIDFDFIKVNQSWLWSRICSCCLPLPTCCHWILSILKVEVINVFAVRSGCRGWSWIITRYEKTCHGDLNLGAPFCPSSSCRISCYSNGPILNTVINRVVLSNKFPIVIAIAICQFATAGITIEPALCIVILT